METRLKNIWTEIGAACLQRVLVVFVLFQFLGLDLTEIAARRDGKNYLLLAHACMTGVYSDVVFADRQYFIGYPAVLALFWKFIPAGAAYLIIQLLCIAGTVLVGRLLFRSEWTSRWFLFCAPAYVLFTSLNMSEGLIVFLIFTAALFFDRGKMFLCAMTLGAAFLVRPQYAGFLWLVLAFESFRMRSKKTILLLAIPVFFVGAMFAFNALAFGDAFVNFRMYARHESSGILALPVISYFKTLAGPSVSLGHKIYSGAFTLFTAAGLFMLWKKWAGKQADRIEGVFLKWSVLQFLFFMSLTTRWAFLEMPRYMVVLFPAALMGFQKYLPRSRWALLAGAVLCAAFSIALEVSGNN